jgi:hypothetical protein
MKRDESHQAREERSKIAYLHGWKHRSQGVLAMVSICGRTLSNISVSAVVRLWVHCVRYPFHFGDERHRAPRVLTVHLSFQSITYNLHMQGRRRFRQS